MNTWTKIKLYVGIAWTWFYMSIGYYGAWSRLYRFFWEFKYRNLELSTYASYEELLAVTRKLIWTADTWQQLFDAISRPEKVEYIAKWGIEKRVGDCDEFAIYNVATLNKSLREGKFIGDFELEGALLMSVMWMDKDGNYGGHNVALLLKDLEYSQGYAYMDYGMPSATKNTVREVVQLVLDRYAPGGTLLTYAVQTEDLKIVRVAR